MAIKFVNNGEIKLPLSAILSIVEETNKKGVNKDDMITINNQMYPIQPEKPVTSVMVNDKFSLALNDCM